MDLIVTVDTEEEGIWNGTYGRSPTVENLRGLTRFQSFCENFDVTPTYLVDTPVVQNDEAVALLSETQVRGRCEVGAHLHPWCTPPFEEDRTERNSFMCNLPERLQREKLTVLTESIADRFGRRPTSFRAGRYGLNVVGARILRELGYVVDSSVIPFKDYSNGGGPDFSSVPLIPYLIGKRGLSAHDESGFLLEVPITSGFNRQDFDAAHRLRSRMARRPLRHLRLVGILDRLGIVRALKFSPEQASAKAMKKLVDICHRRRAPCVVMMLHSSSLLPGFSPYVASAALLESFYRSLEDTFAYCQSQRIRGVGLTQFAEGYLAGIEHIVGGGSTT